MQTVKLDHETPIFGVNIKKKTVKPPEGGPLLVINGVITITPISRVRLGGWRKGLESNHLLINGRIWRTLQKVSKSGGSTNPIAKYVRQKRFIFPKFRDEH